MGFAFTVVSGVALGLGVMTGIKPLPSPVVPPETAKFADVRFVPGPKPPFAPSGAAGRLSGYFEQIGYRLDHQQPAPRVFLSSMPEDMDQLDDVAERKALFFRIILPLALLVNEEVAAERDRLEVLLARRARGEALEAADRRWLARVAARYRTDDLDRLARRIDTVPPSLILAQAAEESGWGTSRFVREGNALFGQWAYDDAEGIVPAGRKDGQTHVIRSFDTLLGSVRAYVRNLNTHPAYRELRGLRAAYRTLGEPASGAVLAGTLTRYSQRGEEYVRSLRTIMRVNRLERFDAARLAPRAPNLPPPAVKRGAHADTLVLQDLDL